MYRSKRQIEIGIIVLFIISSTFIHFIIWAFVDYFNHTLTINKDEFLSLLFWSFFNAFVVDFGLIVIYYINQNRVKNGKKPI
jgi:hypothetical protein